MSLVQVAISLGVLIGVACADPDVAVGPSIDVGEARFDVEIASTSEERRRGLSGRENLAGSSGMLFVFESTRVPSFWMKDMLIPLDFVWIGEECNVVDLHTDVPPPAAGASSGSLPRYSPGSAVRYVLEINAGRVGELGIEVGDRVAFHGISEVEDACR